MRTPTLTDVHALAERIGVDELVLGASRSWPAPVRPLADPPPGSGLRPVMGDAGAPLVGHTLELFLDFLPSSLARRERFGPVSWARSPIGQVVSVSGPEACEQVLRNPDRDFANGPAWEALIGPFFRGGLMLRDFDEHLAHRRIMQQAFTRDRLRAHLAQMQPWLEQGVAAWEPQQDFAVLPAIKHLLLRSASDIFLGEHPEPEIEQEVFQAFIDTVRAGSAWFRRDGLPGSRWWKGLRGREVLEEFFSTSLPAHRTGGTGQDMFSALATMSDEDGNSFTGQEVVDHMIFLLMAAHDTSTITLSTMLWAMAAHPEWQQRARQESDAIDRDHLTWEDLDRLPSIDLLQQEALRYVAPVLIMMRSTVRDTAILGHFVPADTHVMVSPFVTHRDPQVWDDPDRFDPTRFAPGGEAENQHPYAWIPFGGGVHKCIGLHMAGVQIKAVLHQVLRPWEWSLRPGYELKLDTTTLPVPRDGLPVRLRPRS